MNGATHLVTGGCGLQGSHIVLKLQEAYPKANVVVMSRNPTVNTFQGVEYFAGDIASPSDIDRVFSAVRPTVVFHCAGTMTVSRAAVPEAVVRKINVDGTRLMLDASKRFGVKAFVFTSSASVAQKYDGGFRDLVNCDETAPTVEEEDGGLLYARTKAAAERLVLAADDPTGMRTVSLRPAVIFGERDTDITPNWILAYRRNPRLQIGSGKNLFSITYAGNSADAHLLAAARLLESDPAGVAGEAFFITNDAPVPFWDFGRAIQRAAGSTTSPDDIRTLNPTTAYCIAWVAEWIAWFTGSKPILATAMVKYCTMNRWYNISKAKERLGYQPKVDWEEGVRRGVKWFLDNEAKNVAQ
ncbi:sterol-4-alpha-carboxylate 3-dehydrogenase [Coniochaeta ligniaria NRRL 30616]|uniref:Sterol-4-alpha-carboxylate 3-dehydrogenase n=1 Tax=Coniochaeta ligniaria NRRL 30616 TaxID=1408157 RepID=A0A1J7IPH3_9PEZI|nr:sterol-4-alpha-carboxylate 3-dehydrogenase [Coniochaeta ligniaria NRRL 30616]